MSASHFGRLSSVEEKTDILPLELDSFFLIVPAKSLRTVNHCPGLDDVLICSSVITIRQENILLSISGLHPLLDLRMG